MSSVSTDRSIRDRTRATSLYPRCIDWTGIGQRVGGPIILRKIQVPVNLIAKRLASSWLTRKDVDYHLLRSSMVIIFLFFGYQKWFEYEARVLIPYISNGPLIFWLYPAFGIRGASWFLGVAEWLFGSVPDSSCAD